jgi:hypothetical protein
MDKAFERGAEFLLFGGGESGGEKEDARRWFERGDFVGGGQGRGGPGDEAGEVFVFVF